jgi:hypothetical protein
VGAGAAPGQGVWRRLAETLAALALYSGATAFYLRPIWRVWRDHIAPDPGDPLLNLHILTWTMRQLRLGLPDLWRGNWFFPFPKSLVLSDHLLGLAAQGLAVDAVTGDPLAAYNALLFVAFPLSGLTAAAVLRATGLGRLPALVGGAVYAFAPFHWSHLSHLQILAYQWVPLVLWSFDRLLATRRARWALAFLAVYALHVTGGNYLAYMVHVPLLVLLVNRAAGPPGWRELAAPRSLRLLLPAGVVAAACACLVFLPYASAAEQLDLSWGAENYRQFGATLPALLTPSHHNFYAEALLGLLDAVVPGGAALSERSLFPGFTASSLAALGIVALVAGRRPRPPAPAGGAGGGGLVVALAAAAVACFLAADLYTLGAWPTALPPLLRRPGAVYSLLGTALAGAAAAAVLLHRRRRGRWPLAAAGDLPPWERGLLASGAVTLLLSFPVLFEPVAEVLPGLGGMRVPTRFHAITLLAVALLAARGTEWLGDRVNRPGRRTALGVALLLALLAESAPRPLTWHPVPDREEFPAVYHWLRDRRDVGAVLELPMLPAGDEVVYMLYSTAHWHPLVNGASGHYPPLYEELHDQCCWPVPDDRQLARLRRWGVTHLVVHAGTFEERWMRRSFRRWSGKVVAGRVEGMSLVWQGEDGDTVFSMAGEPGSASGRSRIPTPPAPDPGTPGAPRPARP